jgi:hypothetical protein
MRNLHELDLHRDCSADTIRKFGGVGDAGCGVFRFRSCIDKAELLCMAAVSPDYDFVSVNRKNRTPNWPEMEQIRELFFKETEIVLQFHFPFKGLVRTSLYMWHPKFEIKLPPYPGLQRND